MPDQEISDAEDAVAPMKLVIDTDPGIDDAYAILLAFKSLEVEVVGLTTVFGNVPTPLATRNALFLLEMAGRGDVPVAEGAHGQLDDGEEKRIAHWVHGEDGMGNTNPPEPQGSPCGKRAAEFIVEQANKLKGELNILALGPLTNLAEAVRLDPAIKDKVKRVLVLGGAFKTNGNVHPAAEANIYGDPLAADVVFSSGMEIYTVGLDATHLCVMPEGDINSLRDSMGEFGSFLHSISGFYIDFHFKVWGQRMMHPHDAIALVALLRPDLFEWREGAVCVATDGLCKGMTVMDYGGKKMAWGEQMEPEESGPRGVGLPGGGGSQYNQDEAVRLRVVARDQSIGNRPNEEG
eukprot:CAMPEP_0182907812 /NCGR_PEP_ID=MMETSP0034_2-20130328/34770_1 /TAXON_ID=156128 /ORGANISM="Nephroselmis pyriformis, Strain CCMP717" /LENGTH=348 /DNA_ID=CAMNT_0025043853 /DNA_START=17 /DNA_END=1059 /DNA_ORIENTATION=+